MYREVEILDNRTIGRDVFALSVAWDGAVEPGQFFMIRGERWPVLLPRAISVCDLSGGRLLLAVQRVGAGTEALALLQPGDKLAMTGPLGNGFPLEELRGSVALVGGGIGVAPLVYAARRLAAQGSSVHCLLGFREGPFLAEAMAQCGCAVEVASERGWTGARKGLVTALLEPERYDAVVCCGPLPMMRAVVEQCRTAGTPVYVSVENKMACGLGACLVCTCADRAGVHRRACKDGPVFRGEEMDFDA